MTWFSDLTPRNVWFTIKGTIQDTIGMDGAEAHVHVGLLLFVIAAVLMRHKRRGLLLSWCFVLVVQVVNELLDARDWINWTGSVNWPEVLTDTLATLFWPTVIAFMLALFRRIGPAESAAANGRVHLESKR